MTGLHCPSRCRSVLFLLAASAALLSTGTMARASDPTAPPVSGPMRSTASVAETAFGKDTLGAAEGMVPTDLMALDPNAANATDLSSKAPYNSWRHHEGEGPDCVALIRVADAATGAAWTATALVIRCDGVLLAPKSVGDAYDVASHGNAPRPTVAVTRADGEEPDGTEKLVTPIPLAGRIHSTLSQRRADFTVLKINDHHVRCLRLLNAAVLQAGMPVRVVWAAPDPKNPAHCLAEERAAVVAGPAGANDPIHWRLQFDANPGPAAEGIPAGAVIVDADSGAGVGICANATGSTVGDTVFTSLRYFPDLSGEVAVAPSREAIRLVKASNAPQHIEGHAETAVGTFRWKMGEMERVAGRPIRLQGAAAAFQERWCRTDVACMPDFYIDTYPVSVQEYQEWLQRRKTVPPPQSWGQYGRSESVRLPTLPATGMLVSEAESFAADQDKRLVTDVEWQRAARVDTPGVALGDLADQAKPLQPARDAFDGFLSSLSDFDRSQMRRYSQLQQMGHASDFVPDPFHNSVAASFDMFKTAVYDVVKNNTGGGWDWMHLPRMIQPLDRFDGDVSVCGVRHVLMNAPEMLLPHGTEMTTAPKPFAAAIDPYISRVQAQWDFGAVDAALQTAPASGQAASGQANAFDKGYLDIPVVQISAQDAIALLGMFKPVHVFRPSFVTYAGASAGFGAGAGTFSAGHARIRNLQGGGTQSPSTRTQYQGGFDVDVEWSTHVEPGFRCAR